MLVSHTAAAVLIPAALRATLGELDRFEIAVAASNSDGILERVGLKEAHLGVVEKPIISESVERVTLCEDELVPGRGPLGRMAGARARIRCALLHRAVFQDGGYRADARHRGGEQRHHRRRAGGGRGLFDRIARRVAPVGLPVHDLGPEFVRRFYALIPRSGLTRDQRALADGIITVSAGRQAALRSRFGVHGPAGRIRIENRDDIHRYVLFDRCWDSLFNGGMREFLHQVVEAHRDHRYVVHRGF